MSVTLYRGDALAVLRTLPDASVDAVVTDPPYGLAEHKPATIAQAVAAWTIGDREHVPDGRGFMGRRWDGFVPPPAVFDECLRVLRPGGHLLVFAGTRTVDLMGLSVRLAGFEIRDSITWLYGSGFPKSLDVGKAIDKAAGAEREVIGSRRGAGIGGSSTTFAQDSWTEAMRGPQNLELTAPATPDAARWQGWGTALKPASEPIIVARKPLAGTVAATVLAHGTGALNIDACRIEPTGESRPRVGEASQETRYTERGGTNFAALPGVRGGDPAGRWPANVVLDEHAAAALDAATAGTRAAKPAKSGSAGKAGAIYNAPAGSEPVDYGDSGGASRFFYCAKASTKERPKVDGVAHPTVKPLTLVTWLVRLVTPPGGRVLDPFAGSGTTGEAASAEGFGAVLVEREESYWPLIRARLGDALTEELEVSDPVLAAVSAAGSRAELVEVWTRHEVVWTEEYTAAARARLAELGVAS